MSTAKTKKIMRRRQKGPLHRRSARPDVPIGAQRSRSLADSIADRSVNPASSPPPQSSRRLSAPATLTRRLGASDPGRGRSEARRARADARASKPPAASPQVNKPATLKRQNASRDLVQSKAQSNAPSNNAPSNNAPSKSPTHGKRARAAGQPKVDFATGRTLFPVESGGKTEYLPIASEATPHEQKLGLFVETDSVKRDAVNKPLDPATAKPASLQDYGTDRTLFATENTNGNREYLPKESEATALELSQGKYVPDDQVELPSVGNSVLDKPPRFDWNGQRTLFATQAANGKIEYLPKRSEATALELSQGRYVKDDQISAKAPIGAENAMSPLKPRYDLGKGRELYAVKTPAGETLYLPRESEADGLERMRGWFIPDDTVDRHEQQRQRTALRDDDAQQAKRRSQQAAKLPAGVNRVDRPSPPKPVHQARDGTILWDGLTPPIVSEAKQRETLTKLRPRYELGKGRMLYPTETAQGKIEYLPLWEDAQYSERIRGLYAAFVPPDSLPDFLANAETQDQIARQNFESDRGNVQAYAQEDISRLLEQAPRLVLRSAQLVSESARQIPELQQQFSHLAAGSHRKPQP